MLEFGQILKVFLPLAAAVFLLKLMFKGTIKLGRSEEEAPIALDEDGESKLGQVRDEGKTLLFRIEKHANVPRIRELNSFGRVLRIFWIFVVVLPILSLLITGIIGGTLDVTHSGIQKVTEKPKEERVVAPERETQVAREKLEALTNWLKFRKGFSQTVFWIAYLFWLFVFYRTHQGIVYIYTNNVAVFEFFGGYSFSAKYEDEIWKRIVCPLWPFEKPRMAEPDEYPEDKDGEPKYFPERPWLLSLKVQMIDEPAQNVNTADGVIDAKVDYVQYFRIPYVLHLYAVYAVKKLFPSVTNFANTKVFEIASRHKMGKMIKSRGLNEMNQEVFEAVNAMTSNWGMHTDKAQVKHVTPPEKIATEMNLRAHAIIEKDKGITKAELEKVKRTREGEGTAAALQVLLESKAAGFDALAKTAGLEGDEKRLVLVIETLRDALEDSNYTLFTSSGGASEIASWIANIQQIIRAEDDVVPQTKGKLERMLAKMKDLLDENPELYEQIEKTLKKKLEAKTKKTAPQEKGEPEEQPAEEKESPDSSDESEE